MKSTSTLAEQLSARQRQLKMTRADLVRRTGISRRTLVRAFESDFECHLRTLAEAMGMKVTLVPIASPIDVMRQQAEKKAERLTAMVQGTSALEAQTVGPEVIESIEQQMACSLLSGSPRRLWAD